MGPLPQVPLWLSPPGEFKWWDNVVVAFWPRGGTTGRDMRSPELTGVIRWVAWTCFSNSMAICPTDCKISNRTFCSKGVMKEGYSWGSIPSGAYERPANYLAIHWLHSAGCAQVNVCPEGGARGKLKASPQEKGNSRWGVWMYQPSFMQIHSLDFMTSCVQHFSLRVALQQRSWGHQKSSSTFHLFKVCCLEVSVEWMDKRWTNGRKIKKIDNFIHYHKNYTGFIKQTHS